MNWTMHISCSMQEGTQFSSCTNTYLLPSRLCNVSWSMLCKAPWFISLEEVVYFAESDLAVQALDNQVTLLSMKWCPVGSDPCSDGCRPSMLLQIMRSMSKTTDFPPEEAPRGERYVATDRGPSGPTCA